jgi:serine/threonine-protein kinase
MPEPTPGPQHTLPARRDALADLFDVIQARRCIHCQIPLPAGPGPAAWEGAPAYPLVLCPACSDRVCAQDQPVPGYQLLHDLGERHGTGRCLARHRADGSLVVLKAIRGSAGAEKLSYLPRFLREAEVLRSLSHPHLVGFRDLVLTDAAWYVAYEFVPGVDAAWVVEQRGPLPIGRAAGWACQVLEALAYAHGRGLDHGDVRPATMLLTQEGDREVVKLDNIRLSQFFIIVNKSGGLPAGELARFLAFVAPERITHFRECKPVSDLYSAAASFYYLLTRRFVHDLPGVAEKQLLMILTEDAVPIQARRADIPEGLARVIHKALAKDPGQRYADAQTMRQALAGFCA